MNGAPLRGWEASGERLIGLRRKAVRVVSGARFDAGGREVPRFGAIAPALESWPPVEALGAVAQSVRAADS